MEATLNAAMKDWIDRCVKQHREDPGQPLPEVPALFGQIDQSTPTQPAPSPRLAMDGDPPTSESETKRAQELRKARLTRLDQELTSLTNQQRDRLLCRAVARELWALNPARTIVDVTGHPRIEALTGGSWGGRDTIRNWIKDLDPRPASSKPGPRPKTELKSP